MNFRKMGLSIFRKWARIRLRAFSHKVVFTCERKKISAAFPLLIQKGCDQQIVPNGLLDVKIMAAESSGEMFRPNENFWVYEFC